MGIIVTDSPEYMDDNETIVRIIITNRTILLFVRKY